MNPDASQSPASPEARKIQKVPSIAATPRKSRRRNTLQVKGREQPLDRLRPAHVERQDRRREPDAVRTIGIRFAIPTRGWQSVIFMMQLVFLGGRGFGWVFDGWNAKTLGENAVANGIDEKVGRDIVLLASQEIFHTT